MAVSNLRGALAHELKDLYNAETQLTKALPKMVKKATDEKLKEAFDHHLNETEQHLERLEKILGALDETTGRLKCHAMSGLIEEAEKTANEAETDEVRDALLIAAAQKVEHYEIASYGTVMAWCNLLGLDEVSSLLAQTMKEEKTADDKLTAIAEKINKRPQATSVEH